MTTPVRHVSPGPEAGGGLFVRSIRRHPLAAFLLWAFTVGQAIPWTVAIANLMGRDWPVQPFILASTLIGLLLPALVITRIADGPEALRALLRRAFNLRVGFVWYAGALLLVPAVIVGIGVLIGGTPPDASPGALLAALGPHLLLPLIITFVPNNWWEEVAWMGFVQARLQDSRSPLVAALIVGPLFALQHSSLAATQGLVNGVVLLVLLAVFSVPFRFAVGWVYNKTHSLFLVGLVHAVGNAWTGGDGFNAGYLRNLYPENSSVTMAHLIAMFILGLVVVLATRGRLGQPARRGRSAQAPGRST